MFDDVDDLHHYMDPQALSRLLKRPSNPSIRLLKRDLGEEYSGAVDDPYDVDDADEIPDKRDGMVRLMKKSGGMVRLLRSGMVRLLKKRRDRFMHVKNMQHSHV